jgi:hypothetical protein
MESITAKFIGLQKKKNLINRKDKATGQQVEDFEEFYTLTIAMKKIKYDRDENIKPATSDPWIRMSISSFDPVMFAEYIDCNMGDEVMITIDKM